MPDSVDLPLRAGAATEKDRTAWREACERAGVSEDQPKASWLAGQVGIHKKAKAQRAQRSGGSELGQAGHMAGWTYDDGAAEGEHCGDGGRMLGGA